MKKANLTLGLIIALIAGIFSQPAFAETAQNDVAELNALFIKVADAISQSSTPQQAEAAMADMERVDFKTSTTKITDADRKELIGNFCRVVRAMTDLSIKSEGVDPETPEVKAMVDSTIQQLTSRLEQSTAKATTLGEFHEQMNNTMSQF